MTRSVSIEFAQPEDAEKLADISKRAFDSDIEVGASGPGGPPEYDSIEAHRRDTGLEQTDYWKIIFNGQIVGGMRVFRVTPEHCDIYGVFIDPDFHRQGIGSEFFRLIEIKYPQVKKWSLDTPIWNVRTKVFYEKLGFVQLGILRWVPDFDLRYYAKMTDKDFQLVTTKISDLSPGLGGLRVEGVVQSISTTREVTSPMDGKRHHVANATLVDDTGSVILVLWNDQIRQIHEGERIRVEDAHVKEFNGQLQLSLERGGQLVILQV
ncbi:MAG: GNAT family N-acetyltransferase [Candidatus Thorarchaeota archaeon]|nr:GNAT family N-acetyltransferase [Candidatus Thorarchaeota archaeon]